MIIVGELINASRKKIAEAIRNQDAAAIQQVAKDEAEAGANFIDVNAGVFEDREAELLTWLVNTVFQFDKPYKPEVIRGLDFFSVREVFSQRCAEKHFHDPLPAQHR